MQLIAYKLLRVRADKSLGPLFINRKQRIREGVWLKAGCFPTKGFAVRPGWHCCSRRSAPHLSKEGRVWKTVLIRGYKEHKRPRSQGGLWYTAKEMKIIA